MIVLHKSNTPRILHSKRSWITSCMFKICFSHFKIHINASSFCDGFLTVVFFCVISFGGLLELDLLLYTSLIGFSLTIVSQKGHRWIIREKKKWIILTRYTYTLYKIPQVSLQFSKMLPTVVYRDKNTKDKNNRVYGIPVNPVKRWSLCFSIQRSNKIGLKSILSLKNIADELQLVHGTFYFHGIQIIKSLISANLIYMCTLSTDESNQTTTLRTL